MADHGVLAALRAHHVHPAALLETPVGEARAKIEMEPSHRLAGKAAGPVHYARRGIVTPEMEYVAIRENAPCT